MLRVVVEDPISML